MLLKHKISVGLMVFGGVGVALGTYFYGYTRPVYYVVLGAINIMMWTFIAAVDRRVLELQVEIDALNEGKYIRCEICGAPFAPQWYSLCDACYENS